MHSDALNELIQTSQARLAHNFAVDYRKEGLKVFVDALHKAQSWANGPKRRKEVDSKKAEKDCAHKEKQYSAERDAAAVALDPCWLMYLLLQRCVDVRALGSETTPPTLRG